MSRAANDNPLVSVDPQPLTGLSRFIGRRAVQLTGFVGALITAGAVAAPSVASASANGKVGQNVETSLVDSGNDVVNKPPLAFVMRFGVLTVDGNGRSFRASYTQDSFASPRPTSITIAATDTSQQVIAQDSNTDSYLDPGTDGSLGHRTDAVLDANGLPDRFVIEGRVTSDDGGTEVARMSVDRGQLVDRVGDVVVLPPNRKLPLDKQFPPGWVRDYDQELGPVGAPGSHRRLTPTQQIERNHIPGLTYASDTAWFSDPATPASLDKFSPGVAADDTRYAASITSGGSVEQGWSLTGSVEQRDPIAESAYWAMEVTDSSTGRVLASSDERSLGSGVEHFSNFSGAVTSMPYSQIRCVDIPAHDDLVVTVAESTPGHGTTYAKVGMDNSQQTCRLTSTRGEPGLL